MFVSERLLTNRTVFFKVLRSYKEVDRYGIDGTESARGPIGVDKKAELAGDHGHQSVDGGRLLERFERWTAKLGLHGDGGRCW